MNTPSSALACRFGAVLLLSVFLLSACGGGGGGADLGTPSDPGGGTDVLPSEPVSLVMPGVDSFSPLYVQADGQPSSPIIWVYRVNDGRPLNVEAEEGSFVLSFPNLMLVTFDPGAGVRMTNLQFRYSGTVHGQPEPVTGIGAADIFEQLTFADECPRLFGRSAMLYMQDEADDPVFTFGANSELDYPAPLAWFPDCPDLGTRVPAADDEPAELLEVHLLGSMTSTAGGVPLRTGDFEGFPGSPDQWIVSEVLDEMKVQDRVFRDVVGVDLVTLVPDLAQPESPDRNDVQVVRMWFARGVGLIRAEGAFRFWGQPVDVDLVDLHR